MHPAVKALNIKIAWVLGTCETQRIVLVGYSFGAWVIEDWLGKNQDLWKRIGAVEVYGDPLWYRSSTDGTYGGVARRRLQKVDVDPYMHSPPGYDDLLDGLLKDRWQSLCLSRDPVCGEGYGQNLWKDGSQMLAAVNCDKDFCEHQKYAPSPGSGRTGYGLTKFGAREPVAEFPAEAT